MTGHCDARVALFGRQGGETHASSAAWSYGTDRDATSAGAGGRQDARETQSEKQGEKDRE